MSRTIRALSLLCACNVIALAGGCMGNVNPNQSVAQLLEKLAQTAQQIPALNQMTVGDLVAGYQQFANQLGQASATTTPQAGLTAAQQQQLQTLQGKLDSGQITQAEFAAQASSAVGNIAPHHAFGGPFPHAPGSPAADPLNLTTDQQTQAQAIFTRLHNDIDTLRQDAHTKILAVLTPDQQTKLNSLGFGQEEQPGQPEEPRPAGMNGGTGSPSQDVATQLQLTDAQKTQIDQIHTDLINAVQARHQQARDEFRAILTTDQQAILDQREQQETADPGNSSAASTGK